MTQSQFLSSVQLVCAKSFFFFESGYYTNVKELSLPYYLFTSGRENN